MAGTDRRPDPSALTCLLMVSDVGLELALRSAVELIGIGCETLSLSRLAKLMRSRDVDLARLASTSFLIVDERTEALPPIQALTRRLEGRLVRVASTGAPPSRRCRAHCGWIRRCRCWRSWKRSGSGCIEPPRGRLWEGL